MGNDLNILVIGCGSIGERHIRNIKNNFDNISISAFDINKNRLKYVNEHYGLEIYNDLDKALTNDINAALICSPPHKHVEQALKCVDNDINIFIEKPISNNLKDVKKLIKKVSLKNLVGSVGYNFRFHEGLILIREMLKEQELTEIISMRCFFGDYLPQWRLKQDYHENYIIKNETGGGIILDGSHELDYLRWILGEPVKLSCFDGKLSKLDMETEDIAEIIMLFKDGVIGEVHLDCIRPKYLRECELFTENQIVSWNYEKKCVNIQSRNKKPTKTIQTNPDNNHMYVNEIKNFVETIKGNEKIKIPLIEGQKTLELALIAKRSASLSEVIKL